MELSGTPKGSARTSLEPMVYDWISPMGGNTEVLTPRSAILTYIMFFMSYASFYAKYSLSTKIYIIRSSGPIDLILAKNLNSIVNFQPHM